MAWSRLAGLGEDLVRRVEEALSSRDNRKAQEAAKWALQNFRVDSSKTPKGQKELKEQARRFFLSIRDLSSGFTPEGWEHFERIWESEIKPKVGDLVQYFSSEGGSKEQVELKLSHATYFNRANMGEEAFLKYAKAVEATIGELKGWRTRALKGELKVAFVGTQQMKVQGKYRRELDELWVKATPKVLSRAEGYASPSYIIVHELGHRYERFNSLPMDFDQHAWRTTRYSFNDGESFAELFALGHFGIREQWGEVLDRFEWSMAHNKVWVPGISLLAHRVVARFRCKISLDG